MIDYGEILRLDSLGYSHRQVASSARSSHLCIEKTVVNYETVF